MKMYFLTKESEICWPLEEIRNQIKLAGKTEMEVFEAVPEKGTGMFWCKHFGEIGYSSESCGRQCSEYRPRNGKSGRCRDHGVPYTLGRPVIIKVKTESK